MSGNDRAGSAGDAKGTGRGAASRAGGRPRDPAIEEAIIQATRKRLVADGYSQMTIGDIVADAGVTRPTLYRRWANKYDLVVDALRYGLRAQREAYPDVDMEALPAAEAFREGVRRLDPRYHNRGAMALHGNFMAEAERVPGLLEQMREHGVGPRCEELARILLRLRERGEIRGDVDLDTVVTLCLGSYFADYLRTGGSGADVAERVADTLWPAIAARPSGSC
ncbi:TetR/AcrR family transcriptional regulator [Actinacidiphila sp. bgisy160]|uniref:TetR/AcrR family transcriptional regulator n=1 Tax=Actinacidiphila sp. bgisy160 TaxID=3413796 RepID=UPI003D761CF1